MNCAQARKLLEEHFEGTLAEPLSRQLAAHLDECAPCAAELLQIGTIASALAAVPHAVPSADLMHAISARVRELPSPAEDYTLAGRWHKLAVTAASCLAVFGVTLLLLHLMWQGSASPLHPFLAWIGARAGFLTDWLASASLLLVAFYEVALGIGDALRLAGAAVAPTVGLYAAAEIGVLLGLILLFHRSRKWAFTQATLLA